MTLMTDRLRNAPLSDITLDDALAGLASGPDGFEAETEEQSWREFAECQYTDSEVFFPEKGGENRTAKAICAGCGVRLECLQYALVHGEDWGIWGGLSRNERRRLRGLAADPLEDDDETEVTL